MITSKLTPLPPGIRCPFCDESNTVAFDERPPGTDPNRAMMYVHSCGGPSILFNGTLRKASVEEIKRHSFYAEMKARAEYYMREMWG